MGYVFASCSTIIFFVLFVLQCGYGSSAREINTKGHLNDIYDHNNMHEMRIDDGYHHHTHRKHVDGHPSSHMDHMDPSLNVFFTTDDLFLGKKMPIYFSLKDPSTTPHILPRDEADSIPFSSKQLPYLLKFFSYSKGARQAKSMEDTLRQCELESHKGEIKFCATSLESMLDLTRGVFGLGTKFKVLTTITQFSKPTILLQNYTIAEAPKEVLARKMVACHTMPYPYAVFYCHSQENQNKVFKISLDGENGDRVEAVSVCHMDTSQWDHNHMAFRVLGTEPGKSPVCHFIPTDNLVWVSAPSVI